MTSHPDFNKETTSTQVVDAFADQITGKTSKSRRLFSFIRALSVLTMLKVIITGVSPNGLGAAIAHAIASKSPSLLILTARSIDKAETIAAEMKSSFPSVQVRTLLLDLSSQKSVRRAAAEVNRYVSTVDIVINNAGIMCIPERTLSEDGIELHYATNYIGHFLFVNLIMDKILAAASRKPQGQDRGGHRIINISGAGYALTPLRFSDYNFDGHPLPKEEQPDEALAAMFGMQLRDDTPYIPLLAYGHSNTASMLFSVQQAEKLREKGVSAFSVAPGVIETGIQRHMPPVFRNPHMFYKTQSQGAATALVAAFDPKLTGP